MRLTLNIVACEYTFRIYYQVDCTFIARNSLSGELFMFIVLKKQHQNKRVELENGMLDGRK